MHIYFKCIVGGSEWIVRVGEMHKWFRNFTQNFKRIFAVHRLLDNILLYMQREMRSEIYNFILLRYEGGIYRDEYETNLKLM